MRKFAVFLALLVLVPCVSAQNYTISGNITTSGTTCSPATNCVVMNLSSDLATVSIQVTGTFSGTLQFEVAGQDGQTFTSVSAFPPSSTTGVTSTTSTGTWVAGVAGMTVIRVRASALASGTATVNLQGSKAVSASIVGGGSAGSTAQNALGSAFYFTNSCAGQTNCFQGTDDDSTDNCGAALTTWLTAINGYSGPGNPQVFITGAGTGKAYKLATCTLTFTGAKGVAIHLWGGIDCAQTAASCIQLGASGQSATVATEVETVDGSGFLYGGANLTLAGIYLEPYVNLFNIQGISFKGPQGGTTNGGFGANNATLGSCTNYLIYIDTPINGGTVGHTIGGVTSTSSTSGGCGYANLAGSATGNNTIYFEHNTLGSIGFAGGVGACGSQGIIDGGSYGTMIDNNVYGFGVDLRVQGVGHKVIGNQLDAAQCSAHGVSAAIQTGVSGSAAAVSAVTIEANTVQIGAAHTTNLMAIAGDAGSTSLQGATVVGNQNVTGSVTPAVGALMPAGAMPCTGITNGPQCVAVGNIGFTLNMGGAGWAPANAPGEMFAQCAPTNCANQTANVGATTVFTAPGGTAVNVYLMGCQILVTTQATTSATVPSCVIGWTDSTTSAASTATLPPLATGGSNPATGGYTTTTMLINPKSGTTVTLATTGYASSGATSMAYFPTLRGVIE
jgi:hypothetical protein